MLRRFACEKKSSFRMLGAQTGQSNTESLQFGTKEKATYFNHPKRNSKQSDKIILHSAKSSTEEGNEGNVPSFWRLCMSIFSAIRKMYRIDFSPPP